MSEHSLGAGIAGTEVLGLGVIFAASLSPVQALAPVFKAIQETGLGCILGRGNQSFSSSLAKGGTETGLGAGLL